MRAHSQVRLHIYLLPRIRPGSSSSPPPLLSATNPSSQTPAPPALPSASVIHTRASLIWFPKWPAQSESQEDQTSPSQLQSTQPGAIANSTQSQLQPQAHSWFDFSVFQWRKLLHPPPPDTWMETMRSMLLTASKPLRHRARKMIHEGEAWIHQQRHEHDHDTEPDSSITGSDTSRWKKHLRRAVRKLLSTIDSKEDAMKDVYRCMYHKPRHDNEHGNDETTDTVDTQHSSAMTHPSHVTIQLHYPSSSFPSSSHLHSYLLSYLSIRHSFHVRSLRFNVLLLPLTALAFILPGPNVFLAWNAYRCWAHYQAREGAAMLKRAVERRIKQQDDEGDEEESKGKDEVEHNSHDEIDVAVGRDAAFTRSISHRSPSSSSSSRQSDTGGQSTTAGGAGDNLDVEFIPYSIPPPSSSSSSPSPSSLTDLCHQLDLDAALVEEVQARWRDDDDDKAKEDVNTDSDRSTSSSSFWQRVVPTRLLLAPFIISCGPLVIVC